MKVLIFGASGMIGHGVLKECIDDADVTEIVTVGRRPAPEQSPKLRQIEHGDFTNFGAIEDELRDLDACFYCLGISSNGMSEEAYRRITYDFTVHVADVLSRTSPRLVFCFVSGAGTDLSSRQMWARVKGEAEAVLRDYHFGGLYLFRPAFIQPMRGVTSTIKSYRALYAVTSPFYGLLKHTPKFVTSTVEVGRAMLAAVKLRPELETLENADICALAARYEEGTAAVS